MPSFTHLELHRAGIGLVPQRVPKGARPQETAIYVELATGSARPLRSCTCAASKKKTCDHLRDLSRAVAEVRKDPVLGSWEASFAASPWHRLARLLFEGDPQAADRVRVERLAGAGGAEAGERVRVTSPAGEPLAVYLESSPAQLRFLERTGKVAGAGVFDRAGLLERLALFQVTDAERTLQKLGMKTQRQAWEASFWHRLAYHCVREHELEGGPGTFRPAIDEESGRFTLTYRRADGTPVVEATVPRDRVRAVLGFLAEAYPGQEELAIRPIPLQSILHMSEETELDLVAVRPMLRAIQASGEARLFDREEVQKYRYGNLIWLKEANVLAELEREGRERKFRTPARLALRRSQVPGFLAAHGAELGAGTLVLDAPLAARRIFRTYDRVEIASVDLEAAWARSWYWLGVGYGFGSQTLSLAQLLTARREGLPYLEVAGGWIDLHAPAFRPLDDLLAGGEETALSGDRVRFAAGELLRFQATAERPLEVAAGMAAEGDGEAGGAALDRLLQLRPAVPFTTPAGLATPLRPYQESGVDWLRFLCENRLAGLLCDDMGLGKTLQAMALMLDLTERGEATLPFLVACPTSVVSHWRDQMTRHAPGLTPFVHHGPLRRLPPRLAAGDVLITSYGVLRRDVEAISALRFALAVFDEVQQVKNRQTQSWQAASRLTADVKLGLTGTPIENSLGDLKTLFDLLLPGYLGSDRAFEERFGRPAAPDDRAAGELPGGGPREAAGEDRLRELRRVISPFVLRRLKASVLDELPEKIEDVRTCTLSDDQVKLYRDAVGGRGAELARQVERADEPLPYIHVFALLSLLKQICDHPALALGQLERAAEYASGKWDLYQEILGEALGSGQKVVVFTQFLGMIALMERHLAALGVEHATLTGASVGRGEIVDRFNRDPACRVFLGSLKAGGTGIDLVGGSIVVHYDRWWNAAREDQATDRVYRIGQKRAVQVVKLVTEGTLEEKIAAIIDRKRHLMESVVEEDDPKLAKIFSREELLAMLRGV